MRKTKVYVLVWQYYDTFNLLSAHSSLKDAEKALKKNGSENTSICKWTGDKWLELSYGTWVEH